MGVNSNDRDDKFEKAKKLELLRGMQEQIDYKLLALTRQSLLRAAASRIPWLSRFLLNVDDVADTIVKIGERVSDVTDSFGNESISHGFHFGAIAIAAFDFIRIPLIYLAAFLLNEKIPFKLDNNARWVYSGFLLALTITAIAVPATAPIIAFVVAGTGLGLGVFLLGRTFYDRYKLGKERRLLKKEITREEEEMVLIQDEAKLLEDLLTEATEEEYIIAIFQEIAVVQERYNSQRQLIQDLKNKELHIEQKIEHIGMMRVLDKSIGVGLTSLSIIGLVIALFIPPVGLWILAGAAIAGGVYLMGRLATPVLKKSGNWLISQFKSSAPSEETETKEFLTNENNQIAQSDVRVDTSWGLNEAPINSGEDAHEPEDSTAVVLAGLVGRDKSEHLPENSREIVGELFSTRNPLCSKPVPFHKTNNNLQIEDDEGESEAESDHLNNH